jgi:orotidine-5'-phosphate decarboxylase
MQPRDRLVIAVDVSTRDEILRLVDELRGTAGVFKIGLQAFIANGPSIVREIVASGERVFLDLKIHDIPNTAKHAVSEAASLGRRSNAAGVRTRLAARPRRHGVDESR